MEEETGLKDFEVENLIAEDFWVAVDDVVLNRYYYKITVRNPLDKWDHQPTGVGEEKGLPFHYFWISSRSEVKLVRGLGDYLHLIMGF